MTSRIAFEPYDSRYLESVRGTYNYFVERTTVSFDLYPYTPEQMEQLIEPLSELYRSYVALYDGQYAGYFLLTQHKKRPAFNVTAEVTVYLEPAFTGKGIGKKAMLFLEEVAKQLNFHSLIATICTENEGSIALFSKLGYKQVSHYEEIAYKFDRWLDLACYQKKLK
ncbi:GNAT family N-acetyltransferase [Paenibacillus sacheonensis]|uniref:GNAT family N-acetyltransferase n=1 Tax=Paenibacillus sacheonensis TaxID=742054 RepID=A0A7X4YKB2_9BACL|nr:GNAT family N-acetyltransferase [Paenibacillus sacheonensis]MBM7563685.1 phosphinothricin acetyltransferase [Paenibacillus sacheonensis]NBC67957.1 GNAT family N-acetyltransferase [Paenibacillus sacheonensis]